MIRWLGRLICKLRHGHTPTVWSLRQITCGRCGHVITTNDLRQERR